MHFIKSVLSEADGDFLPPKIKADYYFITKIYMD